MKTYACDERKINWEEIRTPEQLKRDRAFWLDYYEENWRDMSTDMMGKVLQEMYRLQQFINLVHQEKMKDLRKESWK